MKFPSLHFVSAMSLETPTGQHPNKMPFTGILTRIGEPSDSAPHGSNGKRVMITAEAADRALPSLLGMGVNFNPEGHSPREKVGLIDSATIKGNAIHIGGFIYAADFPDVAAEIKANKDKLGFSFEARDLFTSDSEADPVPIVDCKFTGAAILLKEKAAYLTTSINAASTAESLEMSKVTDIINSLAGLAPDQKSKIISELSAAIGTGSEPAGPITSISATAEDARIKMSPLQCANATNGAALPVLREIKARAARFFYDVKDDAPIDHLKLDACIRAARDKVAADNFLLGKHTDDAMTLRGLISRLPL